MERRLAIIPPCHARSVWIPINDNVSITEILYQELLDLSKGNSSSASSQILFDFTRYNYCSTYNLAEGMDSKKKQKAVYSMYSDLNTITPTKKKPVIRWETFLYSVNSFPFKVSFRMLEGNK